MAINISNHRAIMRKYKGVEGIHLEGTKIKGWPSDVEQPTQTQVDAWTIEYEEHLVATAYVEKRVEAYPTIGDQLDALWKGGDDETAMKVIVDKVKTDFPKP
jgi:hypothetical protein